MVRLLADREVDWVLTGSAVLALYGGQLVPNDLDVTPSLAPDNLRRLAAALRDLDAVPAFLPDWPDGLSLAQCRSWTPQPATEQHLDHLFVTRLGMADVPPRLCGSYDVLIERATRVDVGRVPVQVCHLDEVLTRLDGRTRPKDRQRAAVYQQLRRHPPAAPDPAGVRWLIEQLAAG